MKLEYLKQAVDLSQQSMDEGKFPAGAVLVRGGEIVAQSTSPSGYTHAEMVVIDEALVTLGGKLEGTHSQLNGFELYTSMESCMMCVGKIYWSGIEKVYYTLPRKDVDRYLGYEGEYEIGELTKKLNRNVKFVRDDTYYEEALRIYRAWEEKVKG